MTGYLAHNQMTGLPTRNRMKGCLERQTPIRGKGVRRGQHSCCVEHGGEDRPYAVSFVRTWYVRSWYLVYLCTFIVSSARPVPEGNG